MQVILKENSCVRTKISKLGDGKRISSPFYAIFVRTQLFYLRITCIFLHFAVPLHREEGVKSFARKKVLDTLK